MSAGCQTVTAWDICSATPASPPPTNNPSSRSTPSSVPAATGCSPRPPAAPAPTGPPSPSSWTSPAPATPSWSGSSTGSADHCATWSTITSLADRGIGFPRLQEAIDTTTPGGKLVFHVFAALAEFERGLLRERTAAGLTAARARGRDHHDPWGEPGPDLSAPHQPRPVTTGLNSGPWRSNLPPAAEGHQPPATGTARVANRGSAASSAQPTSSTTARRRSLRDVLEAMQHPLQKLHRREVSVRDGGLRPVQHHHA